MRLSNYLLPVIKENPSEAKIVSHQLMLRAGMVRQLTSGIYNWLPLGLKVLRNVENIVRQEMNNIGCNEILMSTIQPKELWEESGRYEDYGQEMLRIKDRHERDMLFGPTNEEVVTDLFRNNVKSYKDLSSKMYHIQWKFRDEIRPRFGVMRGREFLMKDAYSFDINEENAKKSYYEFFNAYIKCFKRMGLKVVPLQADTGPIGGDLSHEFHIVANTGESGIFYDKKFDELNNQGQITPENTKDLYAMADDMHDADKCPLSDTDLVATRGIEVGHIFNFADKYSKPMKANVVDKEGKSTAVNCGAYGIGVSRLVGALIEANHDDKGIIWPESVAPFKVGIINLKAGFEGCDKICEQLYQKLSDSGVEVLYDDKNDRAGVKFARMDLIGLPYQLIVGLKLSEQNKVEFKNRKTGETAELSIEEALQKLSNK